MNVVEQEFNALAGEYETNRLAPWYKAHADLVIEHCPELEHGGILDVGCGTGYLLRQFLRRHTGVSGVGVDIAPRMIEEAQRLARQEHIEGLRFIHADWEGFDIAALEDNDIRIAICANAFHYFCSPSAAARKLYEALPGNGALYVLERDKSGSALTFLWGWLHRHCIKDNVEFYTRDGLTSLFTQAGFREVTVIDSVNRLLWKNKLYTSIALLRCFK